MGELRGTNLHLDGHSGPEHYRAVIYAKSTTRTPTAWLSGSETAIPEDPTLKSISFVHNVAAIDAENVNGGLALRAIGDAEICGSVKAHKFIGQFKIVDYKTLSVNYSDREPKMNSHNMSPYAICNEIYNITLNARSGKIIFDNTNNDPIIPVYSRLIFIVTNSHFKENDIVNANLCSPQYNDDLTLNVIVTRDIDNTFRIIINNTHPTDAYTGPIDVYFGLLSTGQTDLVCPQ